MNPTLETYDYLIARSGIVGRQILKLARGMLAGNGAAAQQAHGLAGFWQKQIRHNRLIIIRGFSYLVITFYTYYIGGSLTRRDQQTSTGNPGRQASAAAMVVVVHESSPSSSGWDW